MAVVLVGCEKEDLKAISDKDEQLSIETAKSYFEQSFILGTATKSGSEIDLKGTLFYPGDFTPQWGKAIYSENTVFGGYDINIHLPKYKYVVEREYYEDGEIKTFEVPVSQRLVVRKEAATGMMSQYVLSLIPDKYYIEKTKNDNIVSLSQWKGFSGIAIYSHPQTSEMISVARFVDGRKFSNVYLLSSTREEIIGNIRKAFMLLGPLKIKSKVRLMTKSFGCGGDGSYGDGSDWQPGSFTHIVGRYYWDGQDVWEDIDGDGIPDCICLHPVNVIGGDSGGGSSDTPSPSTDPFEGIGGGSGTGEGGGGGSGGGYTSNPGEELSDEDAYELGYRYFCYINDDINEDNYVECGVNLETLSYYATPFSYGLNVQGLWSSWLPLVDKSQLITRFGRILSRAGFVFGLPQATRTIVVMVENFRNGEPIAENLTEGEIMSAVSTVLSGLVALGVVTGTAAIVAGFSGAVIGVSSIFVNEEYGGQLPIRIELDNGLVLTILYA